MTQIDDLDRKAARVGLRAIPHHRLRGRFWIVRRGGALPIHGSGSLPLTAEQVDAVLSQRERYTERNRA